MRIGLAAVGALVGFVATGRFVRAAPSSTVDALNALHVPDVNLTDAKPWRLPERFVLTVTS